jgi:DNA-binding response OmpR family regulator
MSDRGHVFIVDHDARSTDILRTILTNNGYVVESAGSGTRLRDCQFCSQIP